MYKITNKGVYNRWTESAKLCYYNGCCCTKCNIVPKDFKDKCRMKSVVIELVKHLGKPIDKKVNI